MSCPNNFGLQSSTINLTWSKNANRLAVFLDWFCGLLVANQTIMADVNSHPDSFPSTDPFNFASATYFLFMTKGFGTAVACLFTGQLSDKIGRRPVILGCIIGQMVGLLLMWFCRKSFWPFCMAQFLTGLLSGNNPVSLAYVSDIFETKEEKEKEFGIVIGGAMIGQGIGGFITVAMLPLGLFAPIWVGFGFNAFVLLFCYRYLVEPKQMKQTFDLISRSNSQQLGNDDDDVEVIRTTHHTLRPEQQEISTTDSQELRKKDDDVQISRTMYSISPFEEQQGEEEDDSNSQYVENFGHNDDSHHDIVAQNADITKLPDTIDKTTLAVILSGSFFDIFGSTSLIPLCLTPLAYETFHKNFIDEGKDPIMSIRWYQGIYASIVFFVIPSVLVTPKLFKRLGLAGTCIFGNIMTGVLIVSLMFVANIPNPNQWTFAAFLVALFVGFPFTVMSQLSTSPMLDQIAPEERRGFVQGLYTMCYNFSMATTPWLHGLLVDATSTNIMLWTGMGISFSAAIINAPLLVQRRRFSAASYVVRSSIAASRASYEVRSSIASRAVLFQ